MDWSRLGAFFVAWVCVGGIPFWGFSRNARSKIHPNELALRPLSTAESQWDSFLNQPFFTDIQTHPLVRQAFFKDPILFQTDLLVHWFCTNNPPVGPHSEPGFNSPSDQTQGTFSVRFPTYPNLPFLLFDSSLPFQEIPRQCAKMDLVQYFLNQFRLGEFVQFQVKFSGKEEMKLTAGSLALRPPGFFSQGPFFDRFSQFSSLFSRDIAERMASDYMRELRAILFELDWKGIEREWNASATIQTSGLPAINPAIWRELSRFHRMLLQSLEPFTPFSLQVEQMRGEGVFSVRNIHPFPVLLESGWVERNTEPDPFQSVGMIFPGESLQVKSASSQTNTLKFHVLGSQKMHKIKIKRQAWAFSSSPASSAEFFTASLGQIPGKKMEFSGYHLVDQDLVIPEGKEVVFQPGTVLDFVKGAKWVSRSPVFSMGTKDSPVILKSSDQSSQGFHIFEAGQPSYFSWTHFQGFRSPSTPEEFLPGAVTVNYSDAAFVHCQFLGNHSEDGLNVVHGKVWIQGGGIEGAVGDGLDFDFCQVKISDFSFAHVGNDGLDFSGSQFFGENLTFFHCPDKGISVGEESQGWIRDARFVYCGMGVCSKDLSDAKVQNLTMVETPIALAAFQKKPEFGPATIESFGKLKGFFPSILHTDPRSSISLFP